jgi:hypothetical protein
MGVTGASVELALVLTSHFCFVGALFVLGKYVDLRYGKERATERRAALMALSFVPVGMFFRMAYTESIFLLLFLLTLYLMERRANPLVVALVVGIGTAARTVGVALLVPLVIYLVRRSSSRRALVGWTCLCLPLSLSGLLGFMAYCQWAFGDPLAFTRNRTLLWARRSVHALDEKLLYLETFEPVWSIFNPTSSPYWGHRTDASKAVFSLYVVNPLYFIAAIVLLATGLRKRWLTTYEILGSLGLLLIPYWVGGYEWEMASMGRYVSVIAPLYLIAGQVLAKLGWSWNAGLLVLSCFFLGVYAGLYAQWYWVI